MQGEQKEKKPKPAVRGEQFHIFLETMMRMLKPLKVINQRQLERTYEMAAEDLKYQLNEESRMCLFKFMKKIRRVVEVEKASSRFRYDLIGIDINDDLCIIDWKTGQKYLKDIQQISSYLADHIEAKAGYIVYLDLSEEILIRKEECLLLNFQDT